MKLVKEIEIYQSAIMADERYKGFVVVSLWYNPKASKHRYVLTRSERTIGFCGSIDSKDTFSKKSDAIKAFDTTTNF